jgi:hypothetical protein
MRVDVQWIFRSALSIINDIVEPQNGKLTFSEIIETNETKR